MAPRNKLQIFTSLLLFTSLPAFILSASIANINSTQVLDEGHACPVNDMHCNCNGGPFYTIYCKDINDFRTLHEVIGNFSEKTFIFELGSLNWTSFPVQVMQSPFLMSLLITNSTFDVLFNTSEPIVRNESSILHHLSLENVTTTREWNWNQLRFLKRLDIFFAYNTTIGDNLPSDFGDHVSKSLKFLSISQSNISALEPESLATFKNLTYLRISHSKLRSLSRDIFPSPSRIGQLRLDHNYITALPDDMFENMPNLTVISLSNNRLSVISEQVFRPLWRPEVHLELRNNPIKCDCRLRWMISSTNKPNIIGECKHPKPLFMKDIRELTLDDLNC